MKNITHITINRFNRFHYFQSFLIENGKERLYYYSYGHHGWQDEYFHKRGEKIVDSNGSELIPVLSFMSKKEGIFISEIIQLNADLATTMIVELFNKKFHEQPIEPPRF